MLMPDRINELLPVFRLGGMASQGDLCDETGLTAKSLAPGYEKARNEVTRRAIIRGAARLLNLDHEALWAWAQGGDQPDIKTQIDFLRTARKCRGCSGLFPPEAFWPPLGRCRACVREQQSPAAAEWQRQVERQLGKAPAWLQAAWVELRESMAAITRPALASAAGRTVEEVDAAWHASELPDRPRLRNKTRASAAALAFIGYMASARAVAIAHSGHEGPPAASVDYVN